MTELARSLSLFAGLVVTSMIGTSALAGSPMPQEGGAGGDMTWEKVDESTLGQGHIAPAPDSAAKVPPAQLSPAEMEELLRRKYEMQEQVAKEVDNNPPGPPGLPEEPVPETTVSKPPPSE